MTMKKFKNYSVIAVGILALLVAVALINASHARAQQAQAAKAIRPPPKPAQPVEVVNTPLAVMADVPLPVFDIDNARQPFQVRLETDFANNKLSIGGLSRRCLLVSGWSSNMSRHTHL